MPPLAVAVHLMHGASNTWENLVVADLITPENISLMVG